MVAENASIKDAIESLGVPHTEVEAMTVNGIPVGFSYRLQSGDETAVYPDRDVPGNASLPSLRSPSPSPALFICDVHLGRLGRLLRLLGFDTLFRNDYTDSEIAAIARQQGRIVLTRDRGLLKRSEVTHGYCVRSDNALVQAKEVLRRFDLSGETDPFTRCAECNGMILKVEKSAVVELLEEKTRRYYDDFFRCSGCGRVYWEGSHFLKLKVLVEELIKPEEGIHKI